MNCHIKGRTSHKAHNELISENKIVNYLLFIWSVHITIGMKLYNYWSMCLQFCMHIHLSGIPINLSSKFQTSNTKMLTCFYFVFFEGSCICCHIACTTGDLLWRQWSWWRVYFADLECGRLASSMEEIFYL